MQPLQKATFTKTEIKQYLGIGEDRFKDLIANSDFPKKKPIIEKWSKEEIDRWLNNYDKPSQQNQPQDWTDFIGA